MSAPLFEAPSFEVLARLLPAYEFEAFIAQGGMGAVYKARQRSLDRDVAVKILPREFGEDPEFHQSFETEAKAMARLNHPNLIGVYDFGDADGMPYIVMEYVNGKSLFHSANNKAIDPVQAVTIVKGICDGLAHAHENGIIHRDIKPANILLTPKAEPKIGDFGLARPAGADHSGIIMGTPGYAAPEITRTPEHADRRSDLFALGVVLYELLIGRCPPYDGTPPPPSTVCGCDPALDRICEKAMHPNANMRYSSAEAMSAALNGWLHREPVAAGAPAVTPARPPGLGPQKPVPVVVRRTVAGVSPSAMMLVVAAISLLVVIFGWKKLQQLEQEDAAAKQAFEARKTEAAPSAPEKPAAVVKAAKPDQDEETIPDAIDETPLESLARLKIRLAAGDRDELPEGSIPLENSDVLVVPTPMTWYGAAAFAESHGAHLVVVSDVSDLTRHAALVPEGGKNAGLWIGAGRTPAGTWASVNGTVLKDSIEPEGEGAFAVIDDSGDVKARPAEELHPFLIEWQRDGSNPATLSVTLRRTGESVRAGEPIYPLGTVAYETENPVYVVHRPVTHAEAAGFARQAGGRLVVADSEEKNEWLAARLASVGGDASYWIGAIKENGDWHWATGAPFDYANWHEVPAGAFEGSAALIAPNGAWRHAPSGHEAAGFIIEWGDEPSSSAGSEEVAALPPAILELEEKAKGLLASLAKDRDKEHAENAKDFLWDLDGWLKDLSKNENASWRRDVALLKGLAKDNRVPAKVSADSGIRMSPRMVKAVEFRGEKQASIDAAFKIKAGKIRDAYAVRLTEASKTAAGPEKKAIDRAAAAAADLDGWLAAMGLAKEEMGSETAFKIISAIYGTGGKNVDVTDKVREFLIGKRESFQVNPGHLGADPNPGWNKGLTVTYEINGVEAKKSWGENSRVGPHDFLPEGTAMELPGKGDPLLGRWVLNRVVTFVVSPDGTATNDKNGWVGKWKLTGTGAGQRTYDMTWQGGSYVDSVTLSRDGNLLKGANQHGDKFDARREPKAAEPLVGAWYWSNGALYVFDDDGTASTPADSGKWKLVSTSGKKRVYSIAWASGSSNELTISDDDLDRFEREAKDGTKIWSRRAGK